MLSCKSCNSRYIFLPKLSFKVECFCKKIWQISLIINNLIKKIKKKKRGYPRCVSPSPPLFPLTFLCLHFQSSFLPLLFLSFASLTIQSNQLFLLYELLNVLFFFFFHNLHGLQPQPTRFSLSFSLYSYFTLKFLAFHYL